MVPCLVLSFPGESLYFCFVYYFRIPSSYHVSPILMKTVAFFWRKLIFHPRQHTQLTRVILKVHIFPLTYFFSINPNKLKYHMYMFKGRWVRIIRLVRIHIHTHILKHFGKLLVRFQTSNCICPDLPYYLSIYGDNYIIFQTDIWLTLHFYSNSVYTDI